MDEHYAKTQVEVANRNSKAAADSVQQLRAEFTGHYNAQSQAFQELYNQVQQLQQKYNLLLSKSFHGGSTSRD